MYSWWFYKIDWLRFIIYTVSWCTPPPAGPSGFIQKAPICIQLLQACLQTVSCRSRKGRSPFRSLPAARPDSLSRRPVQRLLLTIVRGWRNAVGTPSPPTKSFDFRGFGSSRLLILRVGNSHIRIIL